MKMFTRLVRQAQLKRKVYDRMPFLEAYRADTDERVGVDPHGAVGGRWDEIGPLQFEYLRDNGLKPSARMLDIGCGTLRGGRLFIRYLDSGHYTGLEISPGALRAAGELVRAEGLGDKEPRLVLNESMHLTFDEVADMTHDILLAQSVFTHLPREEIEICFSNVERVMEPGGRFFFTYQRADEHRRTGSKDFVHPWSFFEELAGGRVVERDDYAHPRGQTMAIFTKPG